VAEFRVYADATALIGLARIHRLDLFTLLPSPIYVTTRVWEEVVADPGKPGVPLVRAARDEGMLVVVEEGDPNAYPQIDPGESTVVTAAAAARGAMRLRQGRVGWIYACPPTPGLG
jgi:hypothetical protein